VLPYGHAGTGAVFTCEFLPAVFRNMILAEMENGEAVRLYRICTELSDPDEYCAAPEVVFAT
jgi:hypothetical protein